MKLQRALVENGLLSADQNFLCHPAPDDQLAAPEPQYEGSARAVALDFNLDAGNQAQGREMGADRTPAVDGYETEFAAGVGHREGYLVCRHAVFPLSAGLALIRRA